MSIFCLVSEGPSPLNWWSQEYAARVVCAVISVTVQNRPAAKRTSSDRPVTMPSTPHADLSFCSKEPAHIWRLADGFKIRRNLCLLPKACDSAGNNLHQHAHGPAQQNYYCPKNVYLLAK